MNDVKGIVKHKLRSKYGHFHVRSVPVNGICMLQKSPLAFLQLLQMTPAGAAEEEGQEHDQSQLPDNQKCDLSFCFYATVIVTSHGLTA